MAYINVDEVYILDNTGLQVDMATDIPFADAGFTDAQKEQARANIAAGGTNPNLLDNPFFTIRQRGDGPFTTGNAFTVDRWQMSTWNATSPTTTINADGSVTLSSTTADNTANSCALWEVIENGTRFAGKTITVSVQVDAGATNGEKMFICGAANGTRYKEQSLSQGLNVLTYTLSDSITGLSIFIGKHGSSGGKGPVNLTISAVKVELGSASTLANDAPPDYGTELAKCQRYFMRVNCSATAAIGFGYMSSTTNARIALPTPVTMRSVPSVSVTTIGGMQVLGAGTSLTPTTAAIQSIEQGSVSLNFTVPTGIAANNAVMLQSPNTSYIDLSADL